MDQEDVERVWGQSGIIERAIRQTYTYDPVALRSLLEPIEQWDTVVRINQVALKKTIASLPRDIRDHIEAQAKIPGKETVGFRVKKSSGIDEDE